MILSCALALAAEGDLSGYAELQARYSHGVEGTPWFLLERLRPTLEIEPDPRMRVVVSPQLALPQGRYDLEEGVTLLNDQAGAILDLAGCDLSVPDRIDTVHDVLTLERFYVDVYTPRADVRVGRQALNWGSALFFNPTNLFAQVLLTEPWKERQGVNALRVTVPFDRHQVVAVAALDDDLENARVAVKPTVNLLATDLSLLASWRTGDDLPVLGWDVRGTLGVGFWVEGRTALDEPAPFVSAGLDYSFPILDRAYLALQYTYDGTGLAPEDYSLEARGGGVATLECENVDAPEASEPRFTLGRHYALGTLSFSNWEVLSAGATVLVNLEDGSAFLMPTLGWTPGAAWSINAGAQIPLGEGELSPGPALTTIDDPVELDFSGLVPEWTAFTYVRFAL